VKSVWVHACLADKCMLRAVRGRRKLRVNRYSGKLLVDLREFYADKDGQERPGKKGARAPLRRSGP